ncbi:MAG: type III pantothenate kinase [Rhodospirillales bacterium]|nr:type III pantothenate kinase [Rhodospirillales bacterium]
MILAIDCGNTNTVFAVFGDTGERRGDWRSATDPNRTADEFGLWLMQLMRLAGIEPAEIRGAIVASVVPAALFGLKTLCRKYFNCDAMIVGEAGVDLGIKNLVDHPEEVGADRLVNAVAARETYRGPVIVVDFGTATTFDVIDGDGNYRGGVIAPGVNLSAEALHMAAAKLPRVAIDRPDRVIGTGTVTAMKSGLYWGYVAMIEGLVERIKKEFGADMNVIATGGLAPLFADATACIKGADLDLTLRGLYSVYRLNAKKNR